MTLRVVSWNCRRASAKHSLWDYLRELAPDIAVLQEVRSLPAWVVDAFEVRLAQPITRHGHRQRFQSVLLVRGEIGEPVALRSELDWVNRELQSFAGNLVAHRVQTQNGGFDGIVVGAYSPAWPVDAVRLVGVDVSEVKLTQNPNVWVTDLLAVALRAPTMDRSAPMIVAGDFNLCETFDRWKGGPRGNREWLDRMAVLGLTECLRQHRGALTPTYRRPGKERNPSRRSITCLSREGWRRA